MREFGNRRYGMKSESFAAYLDLPRRVGERFELALGSESAPRELLRDCGWDVRDPFEATCDPWRYQEFIRYSKAEFSVAKSGYVACRSGWFSERSAAYLASGRPVVTGQTGFAEWLPCGAGVIAFGDMDEAMAGVEEVAARYEFHCRAAREIAADYFDARNVLPRLIERARSMNERRARRRSRGKSLHQSLICITKFEVGRRKPTNIHHAARAAPMAARYAQGQRQARRS